jgi:hypothetical protein
MSALEIQSPFPVFTDRAGAPLTGASIYIGSRGQNPQTNPVSVYFDDDLSISAEQPIRTSGGFALNRGSPARLFVNASTYSIAVRDRLGALVFSSLDAHRPPPIFYPESVEETNAGVEPVDFTWPVGWVPRYGAVGDGSDETLLVQRALDVGMEGVTVIFPWGVTYTCGQMDVAPGMRIYGHGSTSRLMLAANSPKFTRLFTTEDNLHNASTDSDILEIDGITFDGNSANQGPFTAFEKEQQHPIFLAGDNVLAGRLRARISNCYFFNSCADGISQYYNTDVVVENCFFQECFRSGMAITGGYSKLRIHNCRGIGATHDSRFQIEIDGAGFNGQKTSELLMSNCDWAGGMDIAEDGGSIVFMVNTIWRGSGQCITNLDGSLTGVKSNFVAINCQFRIGTSSSSTHRFFRYGDSLFLGCIFEYTNGITHTNLIQPSTLTGQTITFDNCYFKGDSTYHTTATVAVSTATWASGLLTVNTAAAHGLVANDFVELAGFTTNVNGASYKVVAAADSDTITVAFPRDPGAVTVGSGTTRKRTVLNALSSSADTAESNNQMMVINCKFDETVDCAFDMQQGGILTMRGNHVNGGMLYDAGAAASFLFDIRIGNYTYGPKHRQMCHVTGSVAGCVLRHEMTYVPVDRSGFTRSGNLTGLTMLGSRLIYGSGAPATSDPGFIGDIYRLATPTAATPQQWACGTAGQSGASTTWIQETACA